MSPLHSSLSAQGSFQVCSTLPLTFPRALSAIAHSAHQLVLPLDPSLRSSLFSKIPLHQLQPTCAPDPRSVCSTLEPSWLQRRALHAVAGKLSVSSELGPSRGSPHHSPVWK